MNINTLFFALLAIPAVATAEFKVPSKVHEAGDLEKAKVEAAAKGKPISVLYSNKDSTCPLCCGASESMIKELGNKTIMVYVKDLNGLSTQIIKALEPGKYIPKVAVLDGKLEKSLGMVTYESVKEDSRKAFREVGKAIREYKK